MFDPAIDQKFINSVSWLLVSPTACEAWCAIWRHTWPEGCTAQLKGTSRHSTIAHTAVEDVYLFEGIHVPSTMLTRIYSAGDELVVAFGLLSGQVVKVIQQVDDEQLLILLTEDTHEKDSTCVPVPNVLDGPSNPSKKIRYEHVHCIHTLDYSAFPHLSRMQSSNVPVGQRTKRPRTIGRKHPTIDVAREQTLVRTEAFIGRFLQIQRGPFKGYRGILRLVTVNSSIVELEATTGNKLHHFKHSDFVFRDPPEAAPRREKTPVPTLEEQDQEDPNGPWRPDSQHDLLGTTCFFVPNTY